MISAIPDAAEAPVRNWLGSDQNGPCITGSQPLRWNTMKIRHVLVVATVALACATPAPAASSFYYQRTSLTDSTFDALSSSGYWTGNIRAGSGSGT